MGSEMCIRDRGASTTPVQTPQSTLASPLARINAERRDRLEEKLRLLYQQHDLETRVDEKLRLQAVIEQTETELGKL